MALVVAYNFDEDSGLIAHDVSGNGRNMPLPTNNIPTWGVGHTGYGLANNGTAQNPAVEWGIPETDWTTWVPRDAITTMCWAIINGDGGNYCPLIALGGNTGNSGNFDTWFMSGSAIQIMMRTVTNPGTTYTLSSAFTPDATWHHWAATYDGTNLAFYKDGVNVESGSTGGGAVSYPDSSNFTVGCTQGNNFAGFEIDGAVDDVRIYDRALTSEEIIYSMNNPVRPSQQSWGQLLS